MSDKVNLKRRKVFKVIIIIVIIIVALICAIGGYVWHTLSKMNIEDINKDNLDMNENIYQDVSDKISEEEFDKIVTIALFGSDSRDMNNMESGRSDSIMIASINPVKKTFKLISIPRDSYVNVPGYGYTKINHAYAYGGEELTIKTINSNFGLAISEYVTINFSGLINIINKIGGIEMDITQDELNVLNQYLRNSYQISGKEYVPLEQYGHVTLNGEQALAHSRDRYVGNDFDRASRQRDIIAAIINKLSTMDASQLTSIITNDFLPEVKTNINVVNYTGLLTSVLSYKNEYLNSRISAQVPSTDYGYDKYIDGVYYFGFDMEKAKKDLYSYIYEK